MNSIKQIELQQQIKGNSLGLQNQINELYKWEKEIKRNSMVNGQTKSDENSVPIRSHNKTTISNGHSDDEELPADPETKKRQANEYKIVGNRFVGAGEYESARGFYSKAIEINAEPVFYINRALCFLKLELYKLCIDDCTKAIELDPKLVKAYYRRMQANEVLCNFASALNDCNEVLKLQPKSVEGIEASRRLTDRISGKNLIPLSPNASQLSWSKLDTNVKDVSFIKKPPHLQSKKPLRRIQINGPMSTGNSTSTDKKSKDEENEASKSAENGIEQSTITNAENICGVIPLKSPNSSAQFYQKWRELINNSQKYSYLKIIDVASFNYLIGSQFDCDLLKNLLQILSENFINDKIPVSGILKQIIINDQFKILKLLMDTEDKNAFEKLLKYLETNEPSSKATVLGTLDDWMDIRERVKRLTQFELEEGSIDTLSNAHRLPANRNNKASTDKTDVRNARVLESDVDPLLDTEMIPKPRPPLAHPELDDDEPGNDNVPNTPQYHPGVDDGFFPNFDPRIGDDDPKKPVPPNVNGSGPRARRPSVNNFPYAPGFDPLEGTPQIIPDVNVYQHKKTLAQGMMDLALLSANANQLRYVLESYNRHPYYYFSLVFISLSLILQLDFYWKKHST
ncbi:Ninjurin-A [Pseudolycoriella hygida]|uniref:RNA polymerase II-associated protein 3 n=1 Tax=Pseudolycoriella hygida TaxID=35572 RepID=A0A9Q0S1Y5_9DIPT|nr:Ninjurin-A [Pseudolycoriella hygida]